MKTFILSVVLAFLTTSTFSQITLTSSVTNVSCFGGSNGSASVTATGGTGAYTYTWIPTNTNFDIITGIAAGTYTVNVEDAVANTNSLVVTISEPSMLVSAIGSFTNVSCFGSCNGGANILVNGGTPPYAYNWNNGQIGATAFNLCAGFYGITITDANGCVTSQSVNISEPPQMIINVNSTNASCNGTCNGSATISISGGTPAYSFSSQPIGIMPGINSNLCAGSYTFIIEDANACWQVTSLYISSNGGTSLPNATITTTPYNETCYLTGDGAIDLSITGTNPGPFTYQWSNGATTQDITNLTSNLYWVTVTDGSSNCMTLMDSVTSIGTNCGTIQGNVYIDNNSDCIKNVGDNNYNGAVIIVNPGNRYAYTNTNGDYSVNNLPYGTYSVSLGNNSGAVFPTCTTTLNTAVSAGTPNSINNNLSVGFNSIVQPDLTVNAGSQGIVPGFVCRINYYLNNLNNVGASGVYKATLPSGFIPNITNAFPSTYTLSGDTIIWNFNNVIYFSATTLFYIDFTVPLSTPLGSLFTTCMWAQPTITDLNYANNTYCYSRTVTGSYDPNDKTVSPVGAGIDGYILATETELTYLIRFQNTGNGPAVNIMVKDTLSPNVDINTFEMLSSSHNYNIDILPGNILRWKFNNIMLADSNSNEPASHGYIQYRIKRTSNNTPGTQIKNTAYIYFDFNEPVVTNTAINTIETVTGIKSQLSTDNEWNVYPNPSTGILYIVNHASLKEASQIQVLNSIGQTVFEESITSNYKNIDLSKLNNGIYFVKIVSDKQSTVKRIVLSK